MIATHNPERTILVFSIIQCLIAKTGARSRFELAYILILPLTA
jgi:hypothetical protein